MRKVKVVKEVEVFIVEDGKEFFDQKQAEQYEESLLKNKQNKIFNSLQSEDFGRFPRGEYSYVKVFKVKNFEELESIIAHKHSNSSQYYKEKFAKMEFPNFIVLSKFKENPYVSEYKLSEVKEFIANWEDFFEFYEELFMLQNKNHLWGRL